MKEQLDAAGITNQDAALRQAAGEAFYNTSPFRLRDLTSRGQQQRLKSDFETYLYGFSPNVGEVLEKFKFHHQIPTLVEADALGFLVEKFLDSSINLSPRPVLNGDGSVRLAGLDNHGMGTVFEELIRRFNAENNEEAGEHFTPRDVVQLMARLIFLPVAEQVASGTYLVYDGACGTGGMLTVAEETLTQLARERGKDVSVHLFGQESTPETYAICKADLIIKGEGIEADNIQFGSTLSSDAFLAFEETEQSKIFPNEAFGYWKVTVERPLRLEGVDPERAYKANEIKSLKDGAERSETAPPVIKKVHKRGVEADPLRGLFPATVRDKAAVVEYEPDTDLRDTEQIPLTEEGGIEAFLRREVLPYAPRRLVRAVKRQDWLRDQLHALLLQAAAAAVAGGDTGGHRGLGD